MKITKGHKAIAAGLLVSTLTIGTAVHAGAEVLEDDGVTSAPDTCPESLTRFLDSHTSTYPQAKMMAIIGLDGDGATEELERARASIADACR